MTTILLATLHLYQVRVLAIQEIVMGLWLLIAGFNKDAIKKLDEV